MCQGGHGITCITGLDVVTSIGKLVLLVNPAVKLVAWPLTQPRQLGTTNILMHAPLSGLLPCFEQLSRWFLYTDYQFIFPMVQFFILEL